MGPPRLAASDQNIARWTKSAVVVSLEDESVDFVDTVHITGALVTNQIVYSITQTCYELDVVPSATFPLLRYCLIYVDTIDGTQFVFMGISNLQTLT